MFLVTLQQTHVKPCYTTLRAPCYLLLAATCSLLSTQLCPLPAHKYASQRSFFNSIHSGDRRLQKKHHSIGPINRRSLYAGEPQLVVSPLPPLSLPRAHLSGRNNTLDHPEIGQVTGSITPSFVYKHASIRGKCRCLGYLSSCWRA